MTLAMDCYASGWHFADDAEREHFRRQAMRYLARIRRCFSLLTDETDGESICVEMLWEAYKQTHARFRLRYWVVETAIDFTWKKQLKPGEAITAIINAANLGMTLLSVKSDKMRDRLSNCRQVLAEYLPGHVHEVVIAYDAAKPVLSSDDEFAWWRKFSHPTAGPLLAARWETIDLAGNSSAPTRVAEAVEQPHGISLTAGQEACAAELEGYWHALMDGGRAGGYGLRPPLIVAPSGSGKTRLVQYLADKLNVPLYTLDTCAWMLTGSRADKGTLKLLEEWHEAHPKGIVLVDELDKADGQESGWWRNVNMELMAYCDARLLWPKPLLNKLRTRFLIIGAGAFQSAFRHAARPLGFTTDHGDGVLQCIESDFGTGHSIPEELGFRFGRPILLSPPTHAEFAQRIATIREDLSLPSLSAESLAAVATEAIASRRGQRYLEFYAGQMMRDRAKDARQSAEFFDF